MHLCGGQFGGIDDKTVGFRQGWWFSNRIRIGQSRPRRGKCHNQRAALHQDLVQIVPCAFTSAKSHAMSIQMFKEIAMKLITLLCGLILATTGLSVQAGGSSDLVEEATNLIDSSQDCEDEANKDDDECLLLPPVEEATNFLFALAPLLPIAAAAGLIAAAAGGGGTSTPSSNP